MTTGFQGAIKRRTGDPNGENSGGQNNGERGSLTANGLTTNGLTTNGLTTNGLNVDDLSVDAEKIGHNFSAERSSRGASSSTAGPYKWNSRGSLVINEMKLRIQVLQSSILEKQIVISKLHLWHEMMQRRILGVAGSKRSDFVNYSLSAYPGRCLQVQGDGKIPFILLKPIGRGGFSVVWEVIDTIHCERLAAKFTNYPTDKQESFQDGVQAATDWLNKCFTREVMILTNEKHPNLLRLYYHFRWRINYASLFGTALVYELCAYDLGSWLSRVPLASRRLSQMFGWLKELLQGLKRLHTERHVVHMDIKPQNILVSRDECLKISDFGLHLVLEECGTQQYQAQVPMHMSCNWNGSILYQPPEHLAAIVSLKEDYSLDARYDIWSTGCVAFEMFSETSLFRHFTLSSTEQRLDLYRQVHDYLNALDIDSFVDQHVAHLGARKLIKELLRLRPVGDAAILLVEKCSLMPPSTDEDT